MRIDLTTVAYPLKRNSHTNCLRYIPVYRFFQRRQFHVLYDDDKVLRKNNCRYRIRTPNVYVVRAGGLIDADTGEARCLLKHHADRGSVGISCCDAAGLMSGRDQKGNLQYGANGMRCNYVL